MEQSIFDAISQKRAEPVSVERSTEADDRAVLSQELYNRLKSTSQDWRDQVIEDWDFYLGAQLSQKQDETAKKRKTKTYTVDVVFQAVEQAVSLLTSNRPRFTATGVEDSDTRISQVFAFIMQYIAYVNNFVQKLKQIIKDYYVGSIGWAHVWWNPLANNGKGEICIDTIDPRYVYVDDSASRFFFSDAPHIIAETPLTSEQLQAELNMTLEEIAQFEEGAESLDSSDRVSEFSSGSMNRPTSATTRYIRLDRWSRVKEEMAILEKEDERFEMAVDPRRLKERLANMPAFITRSKDAETYIVHPRNVSSVMGLYSQYGEVFHQIVDENQQTQLVSGIEGETKIPEGFQDVPGSTVFLQLINAMTLAEKGIISTRMALTDRIYHVASIGNKILFDEILPTSHHVIIPLINNFDRTIFPVGDVRRVKREQEFINSIRQLVVTHAAVTTNFKIAYPEGAYNEKTLNEIWNDPQKRFVPYPAEVGGSGLQVLAPPPLPNQLYMLEQQARKNIEERLGIFSIMQGSPTDAPSTYKATVALDEYGQRRIKSKKDDIEEFINQIGKVVVDFIQYYYTDTRAMHLIAPNEKPMTITLRNDSRLDNLMGDNEYRLNDLMVGRYDIMVISGSTLPSNRFALLELYSDLFTKGLLDQETVLQKTEVANVEQVMERIGIMNQQAAQIQMLNEQIKKLKGDQQTADRELIHAKREVSTTKFQKDLEVEQVKAAAARMVYERELKRLQRVQSEG